MTLKSSSYLLPKFSRVPLTLVLIRGISTMVNGTLLNIGKRYEDDLRVIFYQRSKLHLGLDALSNQKILKGVTNKLKTIWTEMKHKSWNIHLSGLRGARTSKILVGLSLCGGVQSYVVPSLDQVIWNSVKIKIGWVLWCIKVQICKQSCCELSCLLFTNLDFDTL